LADPVFSDSASQSGQADTQYPAGPIEVSIRGPEHAQNVLLADLSQRFHPTAVDRVAHGLPQQGLLRGFLSLTTFRELWNQRPERLRQGGIVANVDNVAWNGVIYRTSLEPVETSSSEHESVRNVTGDVMDSHRGVKINMQAMCHTLGFSPNC